MELERAIKNFLQDVTARDLSPKTNQRYTADLGDLTRFMKSRSIALIESVTTDHLREYFSELHSRPNGRRADQGLSPFTIEGMYRTFKTFFRFCEVEEYFFENPMARIRKPKLPDRIVPRLSEEQVEQLLDEVTHTQSPERNLALLMLMVNNGLRRGEVLGLKIDNVHLDENRIRVTGKGRKDRDVPLGDASSDALRAWLAVRSPSLSDHVFINADGTAFQEAGVRSLFVRLQIRVGLKRLYPHLLRHTFAKLYLKRVRDVKSLQQILGHSKSSTTLDLYVEYDFDDLSTLHRDGSPVDALMRTKKAQVT